MSGIFIQNISMPQTCEECPFAIEGMVCGLLCYCNKEDWMLRGWQYASETDKRRDDCPLIFVPEHGLVAYKIFMNDLGSTESEDVKSNE